VADQKNKHYGAEERAPRTMQLLDVMWKTSQMLNEKKLWPAMVLILHSLFSIHHFPTEKPPVTMTGGSFACRKVSFNLAWLRRAAEPN